MEKLKMWNKTDPLYLADGTPASPEDVMRKWPFARNFPTVLGQVGGLTTSIDPLPALVDIYGIDEALSEAEQLAAIAEARERAQRPPEEAGGGADIDELLDIIEGRN